jgi:SAM-dependent methyltransferase
MQDNGFDNGDAVKTTWLRRGVRSVRRGVEVVARFEPVRRALFEYYDKKSKRSMSLAPVIPFDIEYGINTSGALPGFVLNLDYPLTKTTARLGYAGVQPSSLREALKVVSHHSDATFVDLGCGKGRALVLASEFPFRSITGVELTPELAKTAAENARVIARDFPDRTPITVAQGNALDYALPDGRLVIFLFNPFEADVVADLLAKIETALVTRGNSICVIYVNPVCSTIFDASTMLTRTYAEAIPSEPGDTGSNPYTYETVVIWQDAKTAGANAPDGVDRRIVVTTAGLRAEFAE